MEAIWRTIDILLGLSATKAEELTTGQVCLRAVVVLHRADRLCAVRQETFYRPGYGL